MTSLPYHRSIIVAGLIGFLICMALILNGCASSTLGRSLNVGVSVSAAADFATTRQAITSGRGMEANPFMTQSPWIQGLLKVAGSTAVIGGAYVIERRHHEKLAHVLRAAAMALNAAVSWHNAQVIR